MGYYGRSVYRGDFRAGVNRRGYGGGIMRQGGFHPAMLQRGDWLTDLGGVLGKVGSYVDKGLEYAPLIGKVVQGYDQVFGKTFAPKQLPPAPALAPPGTMPTLPSLQRIGTPGIQMVKERGMRGGTSAAQRQEDRADGGGRRRMNVCNTKALRRALRRADGFLRIAKHFVKIIKPGHHVELKPHHHKKRK